jgi:hypothetical protein
MPLFFGSDTLVSVALRQVSQYNFCFNELERIINFSSYRTSTTDPVSRRPLVGPLFIPG